MLEPRTVLQRAADLDIRVDASNRIVIAGEGRVVECGTHGLGVLDAFTWPTSVEAASERFRARSADHWMQMTRTVRQLYDAGVLRDVGPASRPGVENGSDMGGGSDMGRGHATGNAPGNAPAPAGFGAPYAHVSMLNDRIRTSAFLDAVAATVRPGDVVVDVGTGTGVLAVAAARAGASRVYAIESTAIADVAADVIARSGVADRITLVRGWSTEIELPERAGVLVSETIGNDPLHEKLGEIVRDARRRFLTPDARLVPSHLAVLGLPVTIPAPILERRTATAAAVDRWRDWYGIDVGALAELSSRSSYHTFQIGSQEARDWPVVGDPVVLSELDLAAAAPAAAAAPMVPGRIVTGRAVAAGVLNGMLVYFSAVLTSPASGAPGPPVVLSTHPSLTDGANSWRSPVWAFPQPRTLAPGDAFRVRYRFGHSGGFSQLALVAPE